MGPYFQYLQQRIWFCYIMKSAQCRALHPETPPYCTHLLSVIQEILKTDVNILQFVTLKNAVTKLMITLLILKVDTKFLLRLVRDHEDRPQTDDLDAPSQSYTHFCD